MRILLTSILVYFLLVYPVVSYTPSQKSDEHQCTCCSCCCQCRDADQTAQDTSDSETDTGCGCQIEKPSIPVEIPADVEIGSSHVKTVLYAVDNDNESNLVNFVSKQSRKASDVQPPVYKSSLYILNSAFLI